MLKKYCGFYLVTPQFDIKIIYVNNFKVINVKPQEVLQ